MTPTPDPLCARCGLHPRNSFTAWCIWCTEGRPRPEVEGETDETDEQQQEEGQL